MHHGLQLFLWLGGLFVALFMCLSDGEEIKTTCSRPKFGLLLLGDLKDGSHWISSAFKGHIHINGKFFEQSLR